MPTNDRRLPTLGELIASVVIILGAIIGFYVNTHVRLAVLETNQKETIEFREEFKGTLKEMNSNIQEIKLTLKDKQDRDGKK